MPQSQPSYRATSLPLSNSCRYMKHTTSPSAHPPTSYVSLTRHWSLPLPHLSLRPSSFPSSILKSGEDEVMVRRLKLGDTLLNVVILNWTILDVMIVGNPAVQSHYLQYDYYRLRVQGICLQVARHCERISSNQLRHLTTHWQYVTGILSLTP